MSEAPSKRRLGATPIPELPKRFYERADAAEAEGGHALTLDGRSARTPGRAPLVLPNRDLAAAIVSEWNAQGATIDPATMPMTRLANSAIDGVRARAGEVLDDVVRYAGSDLVCYRAGDPDRLVAAQSAAWDPVVAWAREALGARLVLAEGVMFVRQSPEALAAIRAGVAPYASPFELAPLHVLTTLGGSALIALMHVSGRLGLAEAWRTIHVDEIHQEGLWGEDLEALKRRAAREAEFRVASRFLALARGVG